MKKRIKLILILFFVVLYSCEYEAQITYKITNNSSYMLKVVYNDNGKDNAVSVDTDKTELIVVHGQGLSSVDNYRETGDTLSEFNRIDIYRNDTIKSITDYKKTVNWIWHENDDHTAEYKAFVSDSDFEN